MTHAVLESGQLPLYRIIKIQSDTHPFRLSDLVCFSSWKNLSGDEGLDRVLPKTFPKMRAGPDVEPLRLRADRNDLRGRGSRSSYADPADL